MDEAPEESPSVHTEVSNQKVLGETPEAVKPCLEEYEQDQETVLIYIALPLFYVKSTY